MNLPDQSLLIITSEFPPDPGGIGSQAWMLATALHQKGWKIDICTEYLNNYPENNWPFQVYAHYRKKNNIYNWITRCFFFIKKARNSSKIMLSGRSSIIIGAFLIFLLPSKQYFALIHGSETGKYSFWIQKLIFRVLKFSKKIICVSSFTQHKLFERYGMMEHCEIIPNFFIPPPFNPPPHVYPQTSNIYFFTLGTVSKRKGQWLFLKYWPKILEKFPHAVYHMAGRPGDAWKICQNIIQQNQLQNSVIMHGEIPESIKWEWLSDKHVHILLSPETADGQFEGFGISVLETAYMGIPSIGNTSSGTAEVIKHQQTGMLIPVDNFPALENAIQYVLDNYTSLSAMAQSHTQQFEPTIAVNKYIQILS